MTYKGSEFNDKLEKNLELALPPVTAKLRHRDKSCKCGDQFRDALWRLRRAAKSFAAEPEAVLALIDRADALGPDDGRPLAIDATDQAFGGWIELERSNPFNQSADAVGRHVEFVERLRAGYLARWASL